MKSNSTQKYSFARKIYTACTNARLTRSHRNGQKPGFFFENIFLIFCEVGDRIERSSSSEKWRFTRFTEITVATWRNFIITLETI